MIRGACFWLLMCAIGFGQAHATPLDSTPLQTVATLEVPPGNVTVSAERRVIVSVHPSFPSTVTAVIFEPSGRRHDVVIRDEAGLVRVLSVRADANETAWLLSGNPGQPNKRLYLIDARTGRVLRTITVDPSATVPGSFLNDIAIDRRRGLLYLSDPADGVKSAIVVVSIRTGKAWRVLQGDPSVRAGPDPLVIDGKVVGSIDPQGRVKPMLGGVNPITIGSRGEWLYYGAFSGRTVWRVPTEDLADPTRASTLPSRVQRYAEKQPSAGITIDDADRIYATDPGARAIGVVGPGLPYRLVVQDDRRLDWPDGLAVGRDGYVYVCQNGLYRTQDTHKLTAGGGPPFFVTRFRALGPTSVGR